MAFPDTFIPVLSTRTRIQPSYPTDLISYFLVPYSADCPICFSFHRDAVTLSCGHVYCCTCIKDAQNMVHGSDRAGLSACNGTICPVCDASSYVTVPVKFLFVEPVDEYVLMKRVQGWMEWSSDINDRVKFPFNVVYHDNNIKRADQTTGDRQLCKDMARCGIGTKKNEVMDGTGLCSDRNTDDHGTVTCKKEKRAEMNAGNTTKNMKITDGTGTYTQGDSNSSDKIRFNVIAPPTYNRRDVFYQQNDGQLLFLGLESMKTMKDLPLYIYFKIRKRFSRKNMGRIRHLDWDKEITILEF
ncbi:ubiquitin---protein ligase [Trachipleistophora hominis]|uniref:Ubiquitin---protein ligase n=1 Tax=Trachipleistophora hominis TaxID=72359 RepID=L7JYC4_TRAHO|nr:ubiquitin---protein ligase [Trachipleistophora hominis]